jgi:hypothetical protein
MEEAEVIGERSAMEKDPSIPESTPKAEKPGLIKEMVKELEKPKAEKLKIIKSVSVK